jgi:hypothetical protein
MRSLATFHYPGQSWNGESDILLVEDANWFAAILRRIDGLAMTKETFQEDWGVIFYVSYQSSRFWIGLSLADIDWWSLIFHHDRLFQRFNSLAKEAMEQLIEAVHLALVGDSTCSEIRWHEGTDLSRSKNWTREPQQP